MHQSLPQFLIYAAAHSLLALWRLLPFLAGVAAFLLLLAAVDHGTDALRELLTH